MEHHFALLSVIFMMGFVLVFDRVHQERSDARFCAFSLLGAHEVDQIRQILAACQDV
ncbi:MAG TPA: hypothetical protein VMJ75_27555 [Candidatus Acidoferrales bacterium]|nr:hypothetical protein [Candidatus Acidoferrales bacterium]HXK07501.1 hypothetical protein [Verrucomicrobiae bacterium]